MQKPLRVYLACTGVGIINRGLETFARECFDGLKDIESLDITLFKGSGGEKAKEKVLWNISRESNIANLLGKAIHRNGYVVEQLTSFLPFVKEIRKGKPDLIFYSDSNLGFQLYRWRKQIGVPYKLLFSNGAPCSPPFVRTDFIHQVTPFYYDMALRAGEPHHRHFMVPYGISVPSATPFTNKEDVIALRHKLGLPTDRSIVLSVGAIDPSSHKRMDYLIQEVAQLPNPKPYLVMLGHLTPNSDLLLNKAGSLLGAQNYTARCVPYQDVTAYYQIADIFALASLKEGFGRVYLEALLQGLPCIVHDHPIMRYVLGNYGTYVDLTRDGQLAITLNQLLNTKSDLDKSIARRAYVSETFSWAALSHAYYNMFKICAERPLS